MDLARTVALVTGGGYGIGRGIAKRLAAAGALVVVDDIDDERGRETVHMIEEAGGKAGFVHGDIAAEDDWRRIIAFAEETFGGLDVLVNNAGGPLGFFPKGDPDKWGRVLDEYLRGVMLGVHHALPAMAKRGRGAIVNIASRAGSRLGPSDEPEYGAAKAGVVWLTSGLRGLKESANVHVNCICPGWVATETVRDYTSRWTPQQKVEKNVPDPMVTPEDIGEAVVRLARDDSLAGRVVLYYLPGEPYILPAELDLVQLAERWD